MIVEGAPILISKEGIKDPDVIKFMNWYMGEHAMTAWAKDPGLFAGNLKVPMPNAVVEQVGKQAADGHYRPLTRYWEASPSEIVLPAVEEFNHFMVNPSPAAADAAMTNIEAIASKYWASKK